MNPLEKILAIGGISLAGLAGTAFANSDDWVLIKQWKNGHLVPIEWQNKVTNERRPVPESWVFDPLPNTPPKTKTRAEPTFKSNYEKIDFYFNRGKKSSGVERYNDYVTAVAAIKPELKRYSRGNVPKNLATRALSVYKTTVKENLESNKGNFTENEINMLWELYVLGIEDWETNAILGIHTYGRFDGSINIEKARKLNKKKADAYFMQNMPDWQKEAYFKK